MRTLAANEWQIQKLAFDAKKKRGHTDSARTVPRIFSACEIRGDNCVAVNNLADFGRDFPSYCVLKIKTDCDRDCYQTPRGKGRKEKCLGSEAQ